MPGRRLGPENLDDPIVRHMRTQFARLRVDQTVSQALADLRRNRPAEGIVYFYVTDADDRLVGVVPTRRLLTCEPDERIDAIMLSRVVSIPVAASVLIACESFLQHRFLALPVVDADGRMLGVVEVTLFTDEVLGLAEKRELDDAFQLIGVHVAQARTRSPWRGFTLRFPWLVCNMVGGTACALLAGVFEKRLSAEVLAVLALFLTVVLALGESVSMQSMSITLAALHAPRRGWRRFVRSLGREFVTAVLLGAACGLAIGTVGWVWRGEFFLGIALAASICLSMVTACLLGVVLPTAVRAFRGDPKIAAGPIVLASADLCTILFYLTLAGWLVA